MIGMSTQSHASEPMIADINALSGNLSEQQRADYNLQLIRLANNSSRQEWINWANQGNNFYEDIQLSPEELKELEAAGMPTFTINRITPVIEIMKYFITANDPGFKATGWTGDDYNMAQIHEALFEYSYHISKGKMVFGQVVHDTLTKSMGVFHIKVDPNADRGMGEVLFDSIDPRETYIDPTSRSPIAEDAEFIGVAKNMSRMKMARMLPKYRQKILTATGAPLTSGAIDTENNPEPGDLVAQESIDSRTGQYDDVLPYIEIYRKKSYLFYNLFMKAIPNPEDIARQQKEAEIGLKEMAQELEIKKLERKSEMDKLVAGNKMIQERAEFELEREDIRGRQQLEEQAQLLSSKIEAQKNNVENTVIRASEFKKMVDSGALDKDMIIDKVEYYDTRVILEVSYGNQWLYDRDTDYKHYPIIPLPYIFTGKPTPISAVKPMIGKQQEINKSHQIMINHAGLSSNAPWLVQSGVMVDKDDWINNTSMPGGILEWNSQGPDSKPERIQPLQLNSAFYTITQEGKIDLEYIAGVDSSMMGMSQASADMPFRSMMANDEFGTRRIRSWVNNLFEPILQHVGEVYLDVAQHTYKAHKIFRLVDESGYKDYEFNIPKYNDKGEVVAKFFDYETTRMDIRIIGGSTLPINKEAREAKMTSYLKDGAIDDVEWVQHADDILDKEGLLARKSTYSQMQSQIQGLEQTLKDKEDENETLEREVLQGRLKVNEMTQKTEQRKDTIEAEGEKKYLIKLLKDLQSDVKGLQKQKDANNSENSDG